MQVGGQVNQFCRHLGQPIASPAVIEKIGNRFRREVDAFAKAQGVPVLHLAKPDRTRWDDRKLDHVQPYMAAAEQAGRYGVVAIVAAQEFQWVFSASKRTEGKAVWFDWSRTERRVSCYYFYLHDREFGPGFIKICTYFPWPAKVWLNGHEWAKRQAGRGRVSFTELANGFASCGRPERLQALCDRLGPADVQAFFDRWAERIPTPLTADDRAAGYWWELSMRQVEVSRTLVFDDPRRARAFFESLVADNIGIGRPDNVAMVFARQVRTTTKEPFRGRVFSPGTEVHMDFAYKHSRVKQYLKEGRALRIETVINKPWKARTFERRCARCHLKLTGSPGGCPARGRPHRGGCRPGSSRRLRKRVSGRGWLPGRSDGWPEGSGCRSGLGQERGPGTGLMLTCAGFWWCG
jgi:hypothetical protein